MSEPQLAREAEPESEDSEIERASQSQSQHVSRVIDSVFETMRSSEDKLR